MCQHSLQNSFARYYLNAIDIYKTHTPLKDFALIGTLPANVKTYNNYTYAMYKNFSDDLHHFNYYTVYITNPGLAVYTYKLISSNGTSQGCSPPWPCSSNPDFISAYCSK